MTTDPITALSLPAKIRLLSGETAWTTYAEPALGLRAMVLSDGPVGVRGTSWDERNWAACAPSPTALAASWDPDLIEQIGALLGDEARRKGVDVLLAPTVNLHRTPFGGRHFECLSEDPYLTARIGTAYVAGVQQRGVGATIKHYVANDSETERMTYQAVIDERTLHEIYLRPFEDIIATARPWLVMAAYNAVNGPTMTENALLSDPLRTRWGFDGVVVSDWNAVRSTVAAALADTDLAMPGPDTPWSADRLEAAVRSGAVSVATIDAKIERLLLLAERVGALGADRPEAGAHTVDAAPLLRRAAAAGMVLVRNDNAVLPLHPHLIGSLALIGPGVETPRIQGGGSAWVSPPYVVTPQTGLAEALGDRVEIRSALGAVVDERLRPFSAAQVTDPVDGSPGLRVRLRDRAGTVFRDEHREAGRLLWMQDDDAERIALIEASCVFTAPEDGTYPIGFAGVGDAVARLDDVPFFEGTVAPSSADHFNAVLAPREVVHEVRLGAGQQVRLHVALQPGGLARPIALLVLGVQARRRSDDEEIAHAAELAANSDVAVVVVGTTEQVESEGFDRTSLQLPGRQDDLVRAVAAANPRTVVVVNSGAPVELPWLDDVGAVLLTWFPGQEAGAALADVLTGEAEPGGRLPTTWPNRASDPPVLSPVPVEGRLEYAEGIHVGYRNWLRSGTDPALPFGLGLGYTTWDFVALELGGASADGPTAHVTVRNTGMRPGVQTVQLYLSRAESAIERPQRWLAGFARIAAEPGQTVSVDIPIPPAAFAHWSVETHDWAVETGAFTVHVGAHVLDTPLSGVWSMR